MSVEVQGPRISFWYQNEFFDEKEIFFVKIFSKRIFFSFVFKMTEALRKTRSPTVKQRKQHNRLPNRGIIIRMASETFGSYCKIVVIFCFTAETKKNVFF